MASGIFGRPAWTPELCLERAVQIQKISLEKDLDPLLFVAVNIQECDMRETVEAAVYTPATAKQPRKQIGVDACPMGVRFLWPNGKKPERSMDPGVIYEIAGQKMQRWKLWCNKNHKKHHFIAHWNEGNPTYAAQVLAFRTVLLGRPLKSEEGLTKRTLEIVRRLQQAQRERRS